ncbi:MAG: hypothetical protein AAF715_04950 [Myxococcota bacterium]
MTPPPGGAVPPAPLWSTAAGPTALDQTLHGQPVRPPNPLQTPRAPSGLPAPSRQPSSSPPLRAPKRMRTSPLELIWVDANRAEHIAGHPEWIRLVPEVPPDEPDWQARAEFTYGADLYDELHPPEAPDGRPEPERDALRVLQRARPEPLSSLDTMVAEALRRDEPTRLVAVAGRLEFGFDPRRHLETLLSATKPFAKAHRRLGEAIQHATEMLEAPLEAAPDVARRVIDQLRHAWNDAHVNMPDDYLDRTAVRVLLTERAYARRELLASAFLRATLTESGPSPRPVTAYLPEEIDKRLPLFRVFEARLLADLLPRQDEQETSNACLRLVALARVIPSPSGGRTTGAPSHER